MLVGVECITARPWLLCTNNYSDVANNYPPIITFEIFSDPPALIPTPNLLIAQDLEDVNL